MITNSPCYRYPGADDVTIEELDTLLKDLIETPGVPELETFTDFLSINWNADGVEWFETIDTFMYMLLFSRIPGIVLVMLIPKGTEYFITTTWSFTTTKKI